MARRDVAGLAALGALALLANRDKQSNVNTSGISDIDLTGGARSMIPDTGELRDETGALSTLRRNTETGDLYSPNVPITRPSASSVRPSAGPVIRSRELGSQQFPTTRGPDLPTTSRTSTRPMTRAEAIAELNRATDTRSMDVNADRGPNAITDTELSRKDRKSTRLNSSH